MLTKQVISATEALSDTVTICGFSQGSNIELIVSANNSVGFGEETVVFAVIKSLPSTTLIAVSSKSGE